MRIIGGKYKGRDLLPPPQEATTRPITGLVKKSLFGMLGEDMSGMVVADLYCGTGTLGIEALSRGADRCYFAECDRAVVERLRRNLQTVGAVDQATVWTGDVESDLAAWLAGVPGRIDTVFVDPPYASTRKWDWQAVAQSVFAPLAGALADNGIVMLRACDDVIIPDRVGPLAVLRRRQYGNMLLALLGKQGEDKNI